MQQNRWRRAGRRNRGRECSRRIDLTTPSKKSFKLKTFEDNNCNTGTYDLLENCKCFFWTQIYQCVTSDATLVWRNFFSNSHSRTVLCHQSDLQNSSVNPAVASKESGWCCLKCWASPHPSPSDCWRSISLNGHHVLQIYSSVTQQLPDGYIHILFLCVVMEVHPHTSIIKKKGTFFFFFFLMSVRTRVWQTTSELNLNVSLMLSIQMIYLDERLTWFFYSFQLVFLTNLTFLEAMSTSSNMKLSGTFSNVPHYLLFLQYIYNIIIYVMWNHVSAVKTNIPGTQLRSSSWKGLVKPLLCIRHTTMVEVYRKFNVHPELGGEMMRMLSWVRSHRIMWLLQLCVLGFCYYKGRGETASRQSSSMPCWCVTLSCKQ